MDIKLLDKTKIEAIQLWYHALDNNFLNEIISNMNTNSNKIELYITANTKEKHVIRHYKQDDSDILFFSHTIPNYETRAEEIQNLAGAIEIELEDFESV